MFLVISAVSVWLQPLIDSFRPFGKIICALDESRIGKRQFWQAIDVLEKDTNITADIFNFANGQKISVETNTDEIKRFSDFIVGLSDIISEEQIAEFFYSYFNCNPTIGASVSKGLKYIKIKEMSRLKRIFQREETQPPRNDAEKETDGEDIEEQEFLPGHTEKNIQAAVKSLRQNEWYSIIRNGCKLSRIITEAPRENLEQTLGVISALAENGFEGAVEAVPYREMVRAANLAGKLIETIANDEWETFALALSRLCGSKEQAGYFYRLSGMQYTLNNFGNMLSALDITQFFDVMQTGGFNELFKSTKTYKYNSKYIEAELLSISAFAFLEILKTHA